jgi:hypothetical protein
MFGASAKTLQNLDYEGLSPKESMLRWTRDQANAIPSGFIVLLIVPEYYESVPHPVMIAAMLITGLFGSEVTMGIRKLLQKYISRKVDEKLPDDES